MRKISPLKKISPLVVLGAAALSASLSPGTAAAANSPAFRDCALPAGLDPDFVVLTGATPDAQGGLTVAPGQAQVIVKASESTDIADQFGHDTLTVTVSSPGIAAQTISGKGVGAVTVSVPLAGAVAGRAYTIAWSATFDNGSHACPSGLTPQNKVSDPFAVTVAASQPTPGARAPTITDLRQSRSVWREPGRASGLLRRLPVGTTFAFILDEPARVRLSFTGPGGSRGTLSLPGRAGVNHVRFDGALSPSRRLAPGRYRVLVTAASGGRRSRPRSLAFTIG